MALRQCAPAKLNLGLRVVGRRSDGYHLLDTTFHALQLHDVLWLEDARDLRLEVLGSGGGAPVPAGDDNLVLRAARAFSAAIGLPASGRFVLEKHIPAGGGLGGGSSDAAAALLLLQHRAGSPLPAADLGVVAVGLGADVPFFLHCGTQRGEGIGEQLTPVAPPPQRHFVLLLPPFGTSTAAVFGNYRADLTLGAPIASIPPVNSGPDKGLSGPPGHSGRWCNDLETSAMALHPELARIRADAEACGHGPVSMSGSGSTLFLAFTTADEAAAAAAGLARLARLGVRVLVTRTADAMVGSRTPVEAGAAPRYEP